MFCPNCGRENEGDAVYCQRCGRELEPEEETRVAGREEETRVRVKDARRPGPIDYLPPRQRSADIPPIQEGSFGGADARAGFGGPRSGYPVAAAPGSDGNAAADPYAIFSVSPTLLFVKVGYVGAIAAAFLSAAVAAGIFRVVTLGGGVLLGLVLCLIFLIVPAFYHLRRKLVRYRLTDTTIEIDRGLISRSTQNIPLRRIQDVTVSSTVFQRVMGLGDIVIDNASESGGKMVMRNINEPRKYADMLLRQMHLLEK